MKTSRSKKWIKIIAYNIVVVLLIFTGFEWYLNIKLNNPADSPEWLFPALRKYYHEHDRKILQMYPEFAHYDSTLFYALNTGTWTFSNREFSNEYHINSACVRDDEASLNAPEIIVLGDSYTLGWGVDQNENYPALLEEMLGAKVLNTGVSSYGTAREVKSLERFNTDSLKILIIQYCPNDLRENQDCVFSGNVLNVSTEKNYNLACENHQATAGYFPFKHILNIPGYFNPKEKPKPAAPMPEMKIDSSRLIGTAEAFVSILKASPAIPKDVQILVFSLEAQKCDNSFIDAVKPVLDKQFATSLHDRVSYVDIAGKIDTTHRFLMDPHLNAAGHQVIADALVDHINNLDMSSQTKYWYYDSGDTAIACEYNYGVKHGTFTAYWESGGVARTTEYRNGVKQGTEKDFTENGVLKTEKSYVNDLIDGWLIEYDSAGEVSMKVRYIAGNPQGY